MDIKSWHFLFPHRHCHWHTQEAQTFFQENKWRALFWICLGWSQRLKGGPCSGPCSGGWRRWRRPSQWGGSCWPRTEWGRRVFHSSPLFSHHRSCVWQRIRSDYKRNKLNKEHREKEKLPQVHYCKQQIVDCLLDKSRLVPPAHHDALLLLCEDRFQVKIIEFENRTEWV